MQTGSEDSVATSGGKKETQWFGLPLREPGTCVLRRDIEKYAQFSWSVAGGDGMAGPRFRSAGMLTMGTQVLHCRNLGLFAQISTHIGPAGMARRGGSLWPSQVSPPQHIREVEVDSEWTPAKPENQDNARVSKTCCICRAPDGCLAVTSSSDCASWGRFFLGFPAEAGCS